MSNKPDLGQLAGFCSVIKLIGNPNRLQILAALVEREMPVSEIESVLSIKQPTLSHELKKLRDKKLVVTRKQSKAVFYAIADQEVRDLIVGIDSLRKNSGSPLFQQTEQVQPHTSPAPSNNVLQKRLGECGQFPIISH